MDTSQPTEVELRLNIYTVPSVMAAQPQPRERGHMASGQWDHPLSCTQKGPQKAEGLVTSTQGDRPLCSEY